MDIIEIYELNNNKTSISIIYDDDGNVLFKAKDILKILKIEKNNKSFKNYTDYEKKIINYKTKGGMQNTIFLTELGLYRVMFSSKSDESIQFKFWVYDVLNNIHKKGFHIINSKKNKIEQNISKQYVELATHRNILRAYDKKKIVYFARLTSIDSNNKYVLKIGITDDINERVSSLKSTFGFTLFMNAIEVYNNRGLETFLHNHSYLSEFKYTEPINGNKSKETFYVNDLIYSNIVSIAEFASNEYNSFTPEQKIQKAELDNERLKLEIEKKKININEELFKNLAIHLLNNDLNFDDKCKTFINSLQQFNKSINEAEKNTTPYLINTKPRDNTRGPKVQQYDPETLKLIKTYNTYIDITRDIDGSSQSAIRNAARENYIYKGYRWYAIDRNSDDKEYIIPPTKKVQQANRSDLIAMINPLKTEIVKVYKTQKEASLDRALKSGASIARAISSGSIASGHYWQFYNDLDDSLKSTYKHELPIRNSEANGVTGISINQIDPNTNNIIETFYSVSDVLRKFQMSRTTLKNALENKYITHNYLWTYNNN